MLRLPLLSRAAARSVSTAAALPAEAPIALFGVAGRYATALYTAAAKKSELLAVETDLNMFAQSMEASPALKAFATDPSVPRQDKSKILVDSLASVGACTTTKNAFATMCEGGRMAYLPKVMEMYGSLMSAAKGEVTAVVTTSHPVESKAEMADIRKQVDAVLARMDTASDQSKLTLTMKVNPGLIKGLTIEVGDQYIDHSVATQLKKLVVLLGV